MALYKKIIFSLFFILITLTCISQNKIEYINGKCDMLIFDSNGTVVKSKPFAENVTVTYNTFYKSYYIYFIVEGGWSDFKLDYDKTDEKGALLYSETKDGKTLHYEVLDKYENYRIISIIQQEYVKGYVPVFKIYGLETK
jgi:hypothetical protein